MKFKILFLVIVLSFFMGGFSNYVYSNLEFSSGREFPFGGIVKPSPYDRVKESQIHVYDSNVVIDVPNVEWASYADTHSMEPVLKYGANGLELVPKSESEVHVGDIVAYEANWSDGLVVHRVISSDVDEFGTYYTLKGDNNADVDPEKVRFSKIRFVLIGVLY